MRLGLILTAGAALLELSLVPAPAGKGQAWDGFEISWAPSDDVCGDAICSPAAGADSSRTAACPLPGEWPLVMA